jgi:hypothetical protein
MVSCHFLWSVNISQSIKSLFLKRCWFITVLRKEPVIRSYCCFILHPHLCLSLCFFASFHCGMFSVRLNSFRLTLPYSWYPLMGIITLYAFSVPDWYFPCYVLQECNSNKLSTRNNKIISFVLLAVLNQRRLYSHGAHEASKREAEWRFRTGWTIRTRSKTHENNQHTLKGNYIDVE